MTDAGYHLATLTNRSVAVADRLLRVAGIRSEFERLLSVDDAPAWKPAVAAYAYAAEQCRISPTDMLLVAVHPWDINGASRAGLKTAWIDRDQSPYPGYFRRPDITVGSLPELAAVLA